MSLIFEALKKLEREKRAPEQGVVVVAHSAWPARRAARLPLAAGAIAALALGVFLGRWLLAPAATPGAPITTAPATTLALSDARPAPTMLSARSSAPNPVPAQPEATTPPAAAPTPVPVTRIAASATSVPAATTLPSAVPATPPLTLEAIAERDGVPVALIDGQLVREGDMLGGALIVRIGTDAVELEIDGQRRRITF